MRKSVLICLTFPSRRPTPDIEAWNDEMGNDEGGVDPCIVVHDQEHSA
jgi:hypothetical protein